MDGATVLCTKNTFVDVEATEEASGSCAQERPQSAPPLLWTPESPSSANERCLTPEPVYDAARVSSVPCPIPLPFLGASSTVLCIKNTFVHVEGTEEAFGSCSQERPQTVPPLLSTPESLSSANEGGLTPVLVVSRVSSVSVPIPLSFLVAPSAMPAAVFEPIPNVGSLAHTRGTCRPCAFWHKPLGCRDEFLCVFCHHCEDGEHDRRKRRKAMVVATLQKGRKEKKIRAELGQQRDEVRQHAGSSCGVM